MKLIVTLTLKGEPLSRSQQYEVAEKVYLAINKWRDEVGLTPDEADTAVVAMAVRPANEDEVDDAR